MTSFSPVHYVGAYKKIHITQADSNELLASLSERMA